ncbi:MAG TPA: hypothetical protein VFX98_14365 [Longimicrobiaceae bacterium]|nr:hypothetical protein [Longimicrobiaceae bacterium]
MTSERWEAKPAGLHFNEARQVYELWAYGIIARTFGRSILDKDISLARSIHAAAGERSDGVPRDFICAAVAMSELLLTGTWDWHEVLPGGSRAELCIGVGGWGSERLAKFRRVVLGNEVRGELALVPETKTVAYWLHAAEE